MIKREYIGCTVYSKILNNNILILDDPSRFELYRTCLTVDVFEAVPYKAVSHKKKKRK